MASSSPSTSSSTAAALDAFQRGEWAEARSRLEEVLSAGGGSDLHAMLAMARMKMDDAPGAHEAADRALVMEARNLRAALVKADLLAAQGARREANFYYGAVVEIGGA